MKISGNAIQPRNDQTGEVKATDMRIERTILDTVIETQMEEILLWFDDDAERDGQETAYPNDNVPSLGEMMGARK